MRPNLTRELPPNALSPPPPNAPSSPMKVQMPGLPEAIGSPPLLPDGIIMPPGGQSMRGIGNPNFRAGARPGSAPIPGLPVAHGAPPPATPGIPMSHNGGSMMGTRPTWNEAASGPLGPRPAVASTPPAFDGAPVAFGAPPPATPGVNIPPSGQSMITPESKPEVQQEPPRTSPRPSTKAAEVEAEVESESVYEYETDIKSLLESVKIKQADQGNHNADLDIIALYLTL